MVRQRECDIKPADALTQLTHVKAQKPSVFALSWDCAGGDKLQPKQGGARMLDGEREDDDVVLRRDEVIKRMLATPPQPRSSPKGSPASRQQPRLTGRAAKVVARADEARRGLPAPLDAAGPSGT